MKRISCYCILLSITLLTSSCATPSNSATQARASQMLAEGFIEKPNKSIDEFWIKPGLDLSPYTKIMFRSNGIRYQMAQQVAQPRRISDNTFHISETERTRLASMATLEFKKEIMKISSFMVVDDADEQTMLVKIGLIEVASYVPPDEISGEILMQTEIGSAVVTLEFRDSISNEILAHGFDRKLVKKTERETLFTQAVNRWAELRKMPAVWARGLATKIESVSGI